MSVAGLSGEGKSVEIQLIMEAMRVKARTCKVCYYFEPCEDDPEKGKCLGVEVVELLECAASCPLFRAE